jgi:hypothetical protein
MLLVSKSMAAGVSQGATPTTKAKYSGAQILVKLK